MDNYLTTNVSSINKKFSVDLSSTWKECLRVIKDNVSQMTYNTWFLPIKPLEMSDSVLKVQLPSQFFWEWIDEHFNTLITKTIHEVLGPHAKLAYVISEEKDNFELLPLTKKEGSPTNS